MRGTLVHITVERLHDGRDPHRAMWLWHADPGPLSLDELWRAYLRSRPAPARQALAADLRRPCEKHPDPRRSRHATNTKHDADQRKG